MMILGQKQGKFWWKIQNAKGKWVFNAKKDNNKYWQTEQEKHDKMIAEIYNRAFSIYYAA